mmetsp:Transcript_33882/g.79225  ORF Transcript_33882/g.79225 Transcript_33882/m.79225 type:complete len:204 (+) Transcript_33882:258-869(+)
MNGSCSSCLKWFSSPSPTRASKSCKMSTSTFNTRRSDKDSWRDSLVTCWTKCCHGKSGIAAVALAKPRRSARTVVVHAACRSPSACAALFLCMDATTGFIIINAMTVRTSKSPPPVVRARVPIACGRDSRTNRLCSSADVTTCSITSMHTCQILPLRIDNRCIHANDSATCSGDALAMRSAKLASMSAEAPEPHRCIPARRFS